MSPGGAYWKRWTRQRLSSLSSSWIKPCPYPRRPIWIRNGGQTAGLASERSKPKPGTRLGSMFKPISVQSRYIQENETQVMRPPAIAETLRRAGAVTYRLSPWLVTEKRSTDRRFPVLTNLTCFRFKRRRWRHTSFEQLTTITSLLNWLKEPYSSGVFRDRTYRKKPTSWHRNHLAIYLGHGLARTPIGIPGRP